MELKHLQHLFSQNGYAHDYYEMIFNLLSHNNQYIVKNDREELFYIIHNEIFYHYSYTWHLREDNQSTFLRQLHSLNEFHKSNYEIHNSNEYFTFLNNNLFPIIQEELELFFTKGSLEHNEYDDYQERNQKTIIHFFSSLGLYNLLKKENLFTDLLENQILNTLLSIEQENSKIKNPILKDGLIIIEQALDNPIYFKNFVSFWGKYKKLLLTTSSPENDLSIIEQVAPELYQQYTDYMVTPNIDYQLEKTVLSKKITQFYFTHFEEFTTYAGQIPNPLVWIHESRKFLETQKYIDNMQEKHFEYFKNFNGSSFFESFISNVLFSQSFEDTISYSNVKNILSKNFNFENLFANFQNNNHNIEGLSNFENYLVSLNDKFNKEDLLAFYRGHNLNYQLENNNKISKKMKI